MAERDYAADLLGPGTPAAAPQTDYAADLLGGAGGGRAEAPKKPTKASASSPLVNTEAAVQTLKETPEHLGRALRGFWQGATDLPLGLVQLASKMGPDKIDEAVSEYLRTREAEYQESRGEYADRADVGRVTGNVVASIPVGGKAAAATLPGRMAQGAKVGATVGAATPVNPHSQDFALNKAVQVAGGAVTGAVAVPVVEGLVRAAGATVNGVASLLRGAPNRLTNKATQDAVESTLTVELQKNGVDWQALPKAARDALILETQKALKAGGEIDQAAIQRIADAQKLDISLMRGQASRDPLQFATERNMAKTEIGKPLADRLVDQNGKLIAAVDAERAVTGAVAKDAYEAGRSAQGALRAEDEVQRKAVKAAYDAAKAKVGMDAEVPMQPIAQRLGQVIDEVGAENIPGAVASRLKEFGLLDGTQTKLLTLREAEILRKLIGNNMPGQRTPTDAALGPLKQSIDDAVNSLSGRGDLVGVEAAAAVKTARDTAAQRFEKIESIPALSDMLKNKSIPPEDFVNTYVLRGSVDEVNTLMKALPPGARRDVRANVLDFIRSKAVSGEGDMATFSQAGFNRALDDLGERHLKAVFGDTPVVVDQLKRIGRVASAIQKAPVSSGVNYSSSATTLIDMLDRLARLPVLGTFMPKGGDVVRGSVVQRALQPAAPATRPSPFLTIDAVDEAARVGGGVIAPVLGGAVPPALSRP